MVIDIILCIIMLLCLIFGFKRGFIHTFSHMFGWVLALIAALFGASPLKTLLTKKTYLYDSIYQHFFDKFDTSTGDIPTYAQTLPKIFQDGVTNLQGNMVETVSKTFADMALLIICFVIIFIVVKLILFIITKVFSKKYRKGFTGFFDGLMGLVSGAVTGTILIFILLALLIPATEFLAPDSVKTVTGMLDSSFVARQLYDNNFIVLLENAIFKNLL